MKLSSTQSVSEGLGAVQDFPFVSGASPRLNMQQRLEDQVSLSQCRTEVFRTLTRIWRGQLEMLQLARLLTGITAGCMISEPHFSALQVWRRKSDLCHLQSQSFPAQLQGSVCQKLFAVHSAQKTTYTAGSYKPTFWNPLVFGLAPESRTPVCRRSFGPEFKIPPQQWC